MNTNLKRQLLIHFNPLLSSLFLFSLFCLNNGCDSNPQPAPGPSYSQSSPVPTKPHYILAVHPLHNPTKLFSCYQPLINHLNQQLPHLQFSLEASTNYQQFESKIRSQKTAIILPNPWQTLIAMDHGYQVIAMAGNPKDFKGILIVRKDSGISKPSDLIGKTVSYPSPTALAACIMPQFFLHQHGINVNRDITNIYVGSQESSIMNAFTKNSAAAATWPPPWRIFQKEHPEQAATLTVAWETDPLINNSIMIRNDIPESVRYSISNTLIQLSQSTEGKKILETMNTELISPASNDDYQIIRSYIKTFEAQVRPVEEKPK